MEKLAEKDNYGKMEGNIEKLMNSIKDTNFYYSLPIKYTNGKIVINPYISGENGFTPEFFGNKFFINITPESERLLVGLDDFFSKKGLEPMVSTPKAAETEEEKAKKIEDEKTSSSKKLLSTSSHFEEGVIEGKTIFTDDEIEEANNTIDQINKHLSTYGTNRDLEDRKTLLEGVVLLHNIAASASNPLISFIGDTEFETEVDGVKTKISPFEPLSKILDILNKNPGMTQIINEQQLQDMITNIQSLESYGNKDVSKIKLFFGSDGLNLEMKGDGTVNKMELVKKFIDMGAPKEVKMQIVKLCGDINDKLNKCK